MLEHAREEAEPKMRRLEGEGRKPEESRSGTTLLVVPALKSHVAFSKPQLGVHARDFSLHWFLSRARAPSQFFSLL